MICFQTAQLMRLKGEKGRLHPGKECGTENQDGDDHQQDGQRHSCHFLCWHSQAGSEKPTTRGEQSCFSEKLVGAGLLII